MIYLSKELKKLNHGELSEVATGLGLEVTDDDTKATLAHAIMVAQSGYAAEDIDQGTVPGGMTLEENAEALRAKEDEAGGNDNDSEEEEGGENEDDEEEDKGQNGAADEQEAPKPPVDAPKAKAKPAKAKKYVFASAVNHNGVDYAKGSDASNLEEPDFDMLEAKGLIVEYVKPKTPKDVKSAIEKGEEGFKFVRNVEHNGVEYTQEQSADHLDADLKKEFAAKGFIQLQ